MLWTFLQSFSFICPMAPEKIIFQYFFTNLAFRLPWQSIKTAIWTKLIGLVKYSRNISVKLLLKYLQWDRNKLFIFPIISQLKISCHSSKSTWATAIKNIHFIEANVMNIASSPLWLLMRWFLNIFSQILALFRKFSLSIAMQPIKCSSLNKTDRFGTGLLKEYFCKTFVNISAVRQQ